MQTNGDPEPSYTVEEPKSPTLAPVTVVPDTKYSVDEPKSPMFNQTGVFPVTVPEIVLPEKGEPVYQENELLKSAIKKLEVYKIFIFW
jgi:hypothetical protein